MSGRVICYSPGLSNYWVSTYIVVVVVDSATFIISFRCLLTHYYPRYLYLYFSFYNTPTRTPFSPHSVYPPRLISLPKTIAWYNLHLGCWTIWWSNKPLLIVIFLLVVRIVNRSRTCKCNVSGVWCLLLTSCQMWIVKFIGKISWIAHIVWVVGIFVVLV